MLERCFSSSPIRPLHTTENLSLSSLTPVADCPDQAEKDQAVELEDDDPHRPVVGEVGEGGGFEEKEQETHAFCLSRIHLTALST